MIGIAVVGATLLAGAVLSDAIANLTEAVDPDTALRWKPFHARAQEMAAAALVEGDPGVASRLAREAYERDPTRAGALRVLGVARGLGGDLGAAATLLRDAERLTRRDLPTQLFFIESAVSRGDVTGALRHFDIAMRTSRSGRALLIPILCTALQDPGLTRPIARTLDAVPDWTGEFVSGCADQAPSRAALARVLTVAGRARRASPPVVTAKITQLVTLGGEIAVGRQLYEALLHDAGRTPSSGIGDPRFRVSDAVPPFDWSYAVAPELGGEQGGGAPGLDVHARSRSGAVAWQMMLLPPGHYRLTITGTPTQPKPAGTVMAQVACVDGPQRTLGLVRVAATPRFGGQGAVTIPRDCPSQWVRLSLEGTGSGTYDGHIDAVKIEPVPGT